MSLTIRTTVDPVGPPSIDAPATIASLAASRSTPTPAGATVVGITVPFIRHDFTGLNFHTRNGGTEFRFNTGTLALTLRQEVHVSSALGLCARNIWLQHEMLHTRDNVALLPRFEAELRADRVFADQLVRPTIWHPRSRFSAVQGEIAARIGAVFQSVTADAARRRDTATEYARVERQVRIRCGRILDHVLRRGEYGQGIDILQAALNGEPSALPRLTVDGIYGPRTEERVREFQERNGLRVDGVAGPETQGALGIAR